MTAGSALRHSVRSRSTLLAIVFLLGAVVAGASPQHPVEATTPSCVVPYLPVEASALVAGVTTVTVTENLAQQVSTYPGVNSAPFTDFQYYFSTPTRIRLVLTFSPAVAEVAVDPEYNADAVGTGAFERFTFSAFDATTGGDQVGSTVTAEDSNATVTLGNGSDTIARLQIDYITDLLVANTPHTDTTHAGTPRASLLNVLLPGTCAPTLGPATQSITGTVDEPIAATATLATAGFGGAVTYAVTSGTLPAGLTLNATTGVVSGTPTAVGASTVTITGTGSTSGSATVTMSFAVANTNPPSGEPIPRLALDCTPDPVAAGATVTCAVSNGDTNIDILWSATTASGVVTARGVTLDGSGSGTFVFAAPRGVTAVDVELVTWGVFDSVRVVGGPVPNTVPAGEGFGSGDPHTVPIVAAALLLSLVGARLRIRSAVALSPVR